MKLLLILIPLLLSGCGSLTGFSIGDPCYDNYHHSSCDDCDDYNSPLYRAQEDYYRNQENVNNLLREGEQHRQHQQLLREIRNQNLKPFGYEQ